MSRRTEHVLATFADETRERAAEIERDLIELERTGRVDADVVRAMFRNAHSIKAGANLLELRNIEVLSHGMETVLDAVRRTERRLHDRAVSALLDCLDVIRELADNAENSDGRDVSAVMRRLNET